MSIRLSYCSIIIIIMLKHAIAHLQYIHPLGFTTIPFHNQNDIKNNEMMEKKYRGEVCTTYADGLSNSLLIAGLVAQSVERWTPYGGSIRPGSKSPGFEARRAPDVYRASWRVWLRLVADRSQSVSDRDRPCAAMCVR